MAYNPPAQDNVNFSVESYTAPSQDSVNFQLDLTQSFTQAPVTLNIDSLAAEDSQYAQGAVIGTTQSLNTDTSQHTQAPLTAAIQSLSASQSSYTITTINPSIDVFRYTVTFGISENDISTNDLSSDGSSHTQASVSFSPDALRATQSQHEQSTLDLFVFLQSGTQGNEHTIGEATFSTESLDRREESHEVALNELDLISHPRRPEETHEIQPLEFTFTNPRRVFPEYNLSELQAATEIYNPQQFEYTQASIPIAVQSLIADQDRVTITNVPITIQGDLQAPERKEILISEVGNTVTNYFSTEDEVTIAQLLNQTQDLNTKTKEYEKGENLLSFTPGLHVNQSQHEISTLENTFNDLNTQVTRFEYSPIFISINGNLTAVTPDSWIINGTLVRELVQETRTWQKMVLEFRTPRKTVKNTLRPVLDKSGKASTVDRIDGGFDVLDRTGNNENEVQLIPPLGREKVRPIRTWYVANYEEEPKGTEAKSWDVEVELIPIKEKAHDNEFGTFETAPDYTDSSNLWLFEFDFGDIRTRRVSSDVSQSPKGTFRKAELGFFFQDEGVRVMEEASGKLGATNLREVPDGDNIYKDTSGDGSNTVTISPPDTGVDTIEPGDYIIESFETVWNGTFYRSTLVVTSA